MTVSSKINASLVKRGWSIPKNSMRNLRYVASWSIQKEQVMGTEKGYGREELRGSGVPGHVAREKVGAVLRD